MVEIFNFDEKGVCHTMDRRYFAEQNYWYPFFGPEGEKNNEAKWEREDIAKAICAICPVIEQCLQFALERETSSRVDGIYGGKTEEERADMIRALRVAA